MEIDLLNLIKDKNYFVKINKKIRENIQKKKFKHKNILNELKVSRMTLERISKKEGYWCNLKTLINLGKILEFSENEIKRNILQIKSKNSFPISIKKIKMNKSLARVFGHILGDGGIHLIKEEGKYRAFYVNNNEKLLDCFRKDILRTFGEVKIYFRKRKERGDEIWLPSTIGYFLYILLAYDKNIEKRVPKIIEDSKDDCLKGAFLQAIYDDDGFLYPNKKMVVIAFHKVNLLKDVKKLISDLKIKSNKILTHNSKKRSQMHYFSITGKANIEMFKEKVNFLHPTKKEKLNLLLKSYKK